MYGLSGLGYLNIGSTLPKTNLNLRRLVNNVLRSAKELIGYDIRAKDNGIGHVHDFYFEDEEWAVRYMIADTGPWLLGRRVLVSVTALEAPDWQTQTFPVALTREEVKNGPEIDADKPVSRQQQLKLHEYFGWPIYWGTDAHSPGSRVVGTKPNVVAEDQVPETGLKEMERGLEVEPEQHGDPHLRSMREVIGYGIDANDGEIGDVDDFIVDDEEWEVRYLVVDTGALLPGRRVLISPDWTDWIHHDEGEVMVDLTREAIKNSPEYNPEDPVNRAYEDTLYDYYGRPKYWERNN